MSNLGKLIFQDMSAEERIATLEANALDIENINYLKEYTEEEFYDIKENLSLITIAIDDIEQEKKSYLAKNKGQMKVLNDEKKKIIKDYKTRRYEVLEKCYKFIDETRRKAIYYNSEGIAVFSRPARTQELNTSNIFNLKTGTNN